MNDDLISRKELRKAFKECPVFTEVYLYYARQIIDSTPTVDTTFKEVVAYECGQKSVERPQGKWIEHYDNSDGFTWLTCSRCMFKAYEDDYNFCPNCGADMRGGRE